jgi:hypothetical protein
MLKFNNVSGKWEPIAPTASTFTRYFSIDPADFVSGNGVSDMEYNGVNGASASTSGGTAYMIAPLHLPQDAIITEVKFYVHDGLLSLFDLTCTLQSKSLNSETTTTHATESTSLLTGDATLTATGLSITIDNSTKSYRIKVVTADTGHKVYGARITYTETL